jgi:hypothetical protein
MLLYASGDEINGNQQPLLGTLGDWHEIAFQRLQTRFGPGPTTGPSAKRIDCVLQTV